MTLSAYDNSAMTRAEVLAVQERLKALGFAPGPVDGVMGPQTESAILAFKRAMGLKIRPWVGPQTWELLHEPQLDLDEKDLPWLVEAKKVLNLHEVYDNTALRRWLVSDKHTLGDPAKLPWCGDFVETAIRLAIPDESVPNNPYWALNWRAFGVPTAPVYGSVGSIERNGGGHVFFLVGQDRTRYFALGGNQSNKAAIVPIDKYRCHPECFRWPATYSQKSVNLPYITSSATSSTNEA